MATINYQFSDGHTEAIEVTEEFANGYEKLKTETEREEWRYQWRVRKKLVSMDAMVEQGNQFGDSDLSVEIKIIEKETKDYLHRALSQGIKTLTPRQRDLLKQIYIENTTLKEIAEEFGVSYQAIQNRHAKILNRLRRSCFP